MTSFFYRKLFKYTSYFLVIFLSYILQTTPGLVNFYGITPNLVLPACICIAVYEGEFVGGLFGFFCGLLVDCFSEITFGYDAFFYLLFCVATGLAMSLFLRRSLINITTVCLVSIFINYLILFFFIFVLYDYENLTPIFYTIISPQIVFSSLFALPYCLVFRWLHKKFEPEIARE